MPRQDIRLIMGADPMDKVVQGGHLLDKTGSSNDYDHGNTTPEF